MLARVINKIFRDSLSVTPCISQGPRPRSQCDDGTKQLQLRNTSKGNHKELDIGDAKDASIDKVKAGQSSLAECEQHEFQKDFHEISDC